MPEKQLWQTAQKTWDLRQIPEDLLSGSGPDTNLWQGEELRVEGSLGSISF